jgi:hypothetical protein
MFVSMQIKARPRGCVMIQRPITSRRSGALLPFYPLLAWERGLERVPVVALRIGGLPQPRTHRRSQVSSHGEWVPSRLQHPHNAH